MLTCDTEGLLLKAAGTSSPPVGLCVPAPRAQPVPKIPSPSSLKHSPLRRYLPAWSLSMASTPR